MDEFDNEEHYDDTQEVENNEQKKVDNNTYDYTNNQNLNENQNPNYANKSSYNIPNFINRDNVDKKNNGVDEDLNNAGTQDVNKMGVPKPIAKTAVEKNGGTFSPGNLPGSKIVSSKARKSLGNVKGKLVGVNGRSTNNMPMRSQTRFKSNEENENKNNDNSTPLPNKKSLDKEEGIPKKEGLNKEGLQKNENNEKKGIGGLLGGLPLLGKKGLNNKDNIKAEGKKIAKDQIKKLFIAGLPWTLLIPLCLFIVIFLFAIVAVGDEDGSSSSSSSSTSTNTSSSETCDGISISSTSLSRDDFIKANQNFVSLVNKKNTSYAQTFADKAGTVYDIATKNSFNPELIPIRANLEGYSPVSQGFPSYNNYYGIGCYNGANLSSCTNYSSFDDGVLGYINTVKRYNVDTLLEVYSKGKYAFIGDYWYSPGGSGSGGCYYFQYIKKYMSSSRASEVEKACSSSCSGSSCLKTNDEDQLAYSKFQLEDSLNVRKSIFGIDGEMDCKTTDDENDSNSPTNSSGVSGSDVAEYAVKTFDSYGYSQSQRMSSSYVDCSSMVWRSYKDKAGLMMGGSENAANNARGIYSWCVNNKKTIDGNNLKPGDLVFAGGSASSIYHVEMYYQDGKTFGAHGSGMAWDKQVSVVSYDPGYYSFYCRPFK